MIFRLFALVLTATAVWAQQGEKPKPAAIEGTVLNSVTNAPLRRVEVTLSNGNMSQEMEAMLKGVKIEGVSVATEEGKVTTQTFTATTDAAGKYRIETVPPGEYWLAAKKAGYGDGEYSNDGGAVKLTAGQELKGADFRLVPHATVSGTVTDEDGEPYPMATVTAMAFRYDSGRRRLSPVDVAQTNNKGEFTLAKVPPGRYIVCADVLRLPFGGASAPRPAAGTPETAYVGTYLGNTTDPGLAQRIEVAAGAELGGMQIQLRKAKVVRVSGKLTDAAGQPITTAQIMLMGGGGRVGSMSMTMVSDPEGKFELKDVQPGTYTVMTMQMQGSNPKISMQSIAVADKNVENVVLGARREAKIQGRVAVDGDGKVRVEGFMVSLTASDGIAVMPATAKADKSGAFTVDQVTQAAYDLTLPMAPQGTYVKSVTFNGREALGQVLDLTAITAGTLTITLGTDGGKVAVKATKDDLPAASASVVLVPAEASRRVPQNVAQGKSDGGGQVTLNDVPPGDYLAFAWAEVENGLWFDEVFLKAAQTQAVRVQVRPKGSEEVQLRLLPAVK